MPLSDLHLGHRGVDYAALERRLAFAREFDVKILLLGDLIDGFIPGKLASGMVDQAPIRDQVRAATQMLKEYQDLILCNVSTPHHDGWTYQLTGVDLHEVMARDLDIPLIESGGSVSIAINEVSPYEVAVFHKIKGRNSSINLTHGSKVVVKEHGEYNPDLVVSGHYHKSSVETTKVAGKKRGLIVCGTLKGHDKYGQREGYIGGVDIDAFPVVFLRTDEHDFTIVESMKQAGEFIDGMNLLYSTYART
jgi:predicted MPP superfamily phosphohydrolase